MDHLMLKRTLVAELPSCAIDTKMIRSGRAVWSVGGTLHAATIGTELDVGPVGEVLPRIVRRWPLDGRPAPIRVLLPLTVVLAVDVAVAPGINIAASSRRDEAAISGGGPPIGCRAI